MISSTLITVYVSITLVAKSKVSEELGSIRITLAYSIGSSVATIIAARRIESSKLYSFSIT